jgi:hypothetical protein
MGIGQCWFYSPGEVNVMEQESPISGFDSVDIFDYNLYLGVF